MAKSVYPRVVPVTKDLVWLHDAYRAERTALAEAAESDYLLVNLWRAPRGRALSVGSVEELFGLPPLDRTPIYAASWLSQDSSNSWGDAYPRELWSRSLLYHITHSNIASRASSFVAK